MGNYSSIFHQYNWIKIIYCLFPLNIKISYLNLVNRENLYGGELYPLNGSINLSRI